MKAFLGVLMVLAVSGDIEMDIEGFLGGSVLLQCNCPDRKPGTGFRWQMEKNSTTLVFLQNNTTSDFNGKYKDRAKIIVAKNSSNCSLLLNNLTAADQGQYKGSFYGKTGYKYCVINLKVSANNSDLQSDVRNESDKKRLQSDDQKSRVPFPKVISMALLLGFCLVLWCMLKKK